MFKYIKTISISILFTLSHQFLLTSENIHLKKFLGVLSESVDSIQKEELEKNIIPFLQKSHDSISEELHQAKQVYYKLLLTELEKKHSTIDREIEKYRLKFMLLNNQEKTMIIIAGAGVLYSVFWLFSKLFKKPKNKSDKDYNYE